MVLQVGRESSDPDKLANYPAYRYFLDFPSQRIVVFCRMAENGPEALHALHELPLNYHLLADGANESG